MSERVGAEEGDGMVRVGERGALGDASPWFRLGAPVAFLLLWSGGFAFAVLGLGHAEPMTFLAMRYAVVLAVLAPLVLALRPPPPAGAAAWGHLLVVGFVVQVAYFGLVYVGMGTGVAAGTMALIVSLQPVLVALLAPRFAGERVGALRWAGLGVGLSGAAVVIVARSSVEAPSVLGLLCAVGGLVAMTAGALYENRFGVGGHPVTSNAVQYAVGLVGTLPLAWVFEEMSVEWTAGFVVSLGYLAVANSLVSITLLLAMLRRGEASRVSAMFFLVPPMAALIAWALLGDTMPALAWGGMALAALGVAVATRN